MKIRFATLVWLLVTLASQAAAQGTATGSGFVYVPLRPSACGATAGCASELHVFDGATGAPVITVPLTADTLPVAVAVSPNGKRLYIANRPRFEFEDGAKATLLVLDTATFAIVENHALPTQVLGSVPAFVGRGVTRLATTPDDSRLYLLFGTPAGLVTLVEAFDTQSRTVVAAAAVESGAYGIAHSRETGLVYVLSGSPVSGVRTIVTALDPATLQVRSERRWNTDAALTLSASADGRRLILMQFRHSASEVATVTSLLDPVSLADVRTGIPAPITAGVFHVAPLGGVAEINGGAESISAYEPVLQRVDLSSGLVTRAPPLSGVASGLAVPPDERNAFLVTFDEKLSVVDLHGDVVKSTRALVGEGPAAATPAGASSCAYRLDSRYSSWPRDGGIGNVRLTTRCAWGVSPSTEGWVRLGAPASLKGQGDFTFALIVDPYVPPSSGSQGPRTASIVIGGQTLTVTQAGNQTQAAFGVVDTPADNASGISGSLAVTGWALDDVGVARVRIFRDPVAGEPEGQIYIGDATFVEGARPDVAAVLPSAAFATRAGWGYLLLTNMLPNGGDGTYRIHAYADDIDGHTTLIGSKTISCINSTAMLPFGAVDTPGQGETVSGTIVNWGWALTPQPGSIASDGSTIDVLIDNGVVGHPTYGLERPDITTLFPGYANTNSAVGYFVIDTTTLGNGLHSIAWVVRDNLGRAQGIGSRYFTVINP